MTARAYLSSFLGIALAGIALLALLGLVVDGYGVFGTRLIPASHFPADLRLGKHGDRVTKAIEIAQRQGDTILFVGDSRTQHGLDPDAPALAGAKGYNAALAAATLDEQMIALDYALAHEPSVKRIIWGLSLEAYSSRISTTTDYGDSGFAGHSLASGLMRHLFAYDRVVSSWKALLQARHRVRAPMKRNGVAAFSGDSMESSAAAKLFESELAGTGRNLKAPISIAEIDEAHSKFAKRLGELKAAGLDVDLVIVPVHIWRLELFRQVGIEAQSDDWKRRIASAVEALGAAPGAGKLRLFDFARPHPFAEQPVLGALAPGERRYFMETSHFYPWLGDKVLAKVLGREAEAETQPFGKEIRPASSIGPLSVDAVSVDADIASAQAALDSWEAAHQEDVGYVKELIGKR